MQFLKTLKNLGKIKDYAKVLLLVAVKVRNVLGFLTTELVDAPGSDKLLETLPKVKSAIDAVVDTMTKLLGFFGEDTTVVAQSVGTVELEVADLEKAVKQLKNL